MNFLQKKVYKLPANLMSFNDLEEKIHSIFYALNTRKEIYVTWPKNRLGIQVIFRDINLRSSIRIYPTKTDSIYFYAHGNIPKYLRGCEVEEQFRIDFTQALYNFENNITTAPIEELIQWQQARRWRIEHDVDYEPYLTPDKYSEKLYARDDEILELPPKSFAEEIRMITKMSIKEKEEVAERQERQKEKTLHSTLHAFIHHILDNFRKDVLRKSYIGEGEVVYSLKDINCSTTRLMDYNIDQLEQSMTRNSLMQDLFTKLEEFDHSYLINRSIANNPTDITFKISWNN